MNKRSGRLILLWSMVLVIIFVSGCAGNGNKDSKAGADATDAGGSSKMNATLRILGSAGMQEDIVKIIAPELEKKGIKLENEFYDWTTYDGKQKLAMTSQGGDYDVVFLPGTYISLWANAKAALPLDDFFKKYNYDENDYYESVKQFGKVDGSWYFAPTTAEAMVYFYRKDLFDAAGKQPPKTIDEMYETAKSMTKDGIFGLAYPGGPDEGSSSFWSYFLWSYGGTYYDDKMKPLLNTPEAVKSAEMFAKILKDTAPKGVATWQNEETVASFISGNVAATIMWPGYYGTLIDKTKSKVFDKLAVANVPSGPTGKAIPRFGAWGVSLTANSKNKEAAYEFMYAYTKQETLKEMAKLSSTASKTVNNDAELRKLNPTLGPSADVLDSAQERPSFAESAQINTQVGNAINSVVAGKPAKESLDAVQKVVEGILKDAGHYK
jgi:multiple sugar transport system substrate-binding protein